MDEQRHRGRGQRSAGFRVGVAGLALVVGLTLVPAPKAEAGPFDLYKWFVVLVWSILGAGQTPVTTTTSTSTTTIPTTSSTEATTTTTTVVPPPDEACGDTIYKDEAETEAWECTFSDEFAVDELDRDVWSVQTSALSGFGSLDDCYFDRPENVSVSDGTLKLSVVREEPFLCDVPSNKTDYTTRYSSGSVSTFQKWSQAFGRFEIRAKFPSATAKGLHGALWLWPDDALKYGPWPLSGEIDIAEVYSRYNDRAIPYIHYLTGSSTVTNNNCLLTVDEWHTYVLEWTTTNLMISFDGDVCVDHQIQPLLGAPPFPFDHPFMLALTQGLGDDNNRLEEANLPAEFPATTEIDYVRVWQ